MRVDPTFFRATPTASGPDKVDSTLTPASRPVDRGNNTQAHTAKRDTERQNNASAGRRDAVGLVSSAHHRVRTPREPGAQHARRMRQFLRQRRIAQPSVPEAASPVPSSASRAREPRLRGPGPPWGLSRQDTETIDSLVDPTETKFEREKAAEEAADSTVHSSKASSAEASNPQSSRLTHLTSAGEAHMVDVGSKPATRRVAIACSYVFFGNEEPMRLITANSNKKGDVLSVARIAGIMAAKRTSDLIPLCHPVPISNVEVKVELCGEGTRDPFSAIRRSGAARIRAQVECTGPTGVEMEALAAANGAALTVYDMCKAVDKDMRVEKTLVLYKSGGRSGLHCHRAWAWHKKAKFFEEKGLEVPPFLVRKPQRGPRKD